MLRLILTVTYKSNFMETFIKEKEIVHDDYNNGGGHNLRGRANAGLTLVIIGTVLGGAALLKRGGIGGVLGGGSDVPANVNINSFGGGGFAPTAFEAYKHECEDVLALTKEIFGQKINTLTTLAAQRNTDVAEKFGLYKSQVDADFGLYVNNRDNIDAVNNRINNELFSLYKYTRDKDDETNAKICALESRVAVNEAVRPYQDKIIQLAINNALGEAINYTDRKTCKMITGTVVVPSTPTITGFGSYCCGSQAAAAGAA